MENSQYTDEQIKRYLQMSAYFRAYARTKGLTSAQLEIILCLGSNGFTKDSPGKNLGSLTEELQISQPTVSISTKGLWKFKGLVNKFIDLDKPRQKSISLTATGESFYQETKTISKSDNSPII